MKIEQAHLMRYNCQQIYSKMFDRLLLKLFLLLVLGERF